MSINPYVGWGLSTLAMYFLNKSAKPKNDASSMKPSDLNITQTKIGTPIPVVLGTTLIKSPLTTYYGDFSSKIYTETYSAHAKFNAWPMVFALIAQYIAAPATTTGTGKGTSSHGGPVVVSILGKDMAVGPLINTLFMWLLSWLINGRNLKTTIQKGFKYYLGYQQILCWSSPHAKLKKIYMNENLIWEGSVGFNEQNGTAFVISINNDQLFGGADENGGFIGEIRVYFGGDNQQPDTWMKQEMQSSSIQAELRGLTSAYRPFISVVVPTAYVGKQATIPKMWYEIENIPSTLGLGAIGADVNPAEVLRELHINKDWGLAEPEDLLNISSLKKIGEKLKAEKIGITVPITRKITAGKLIDSICEHINAVKYIEAKSGQLTYQLIRSDLNEYKTGLKPPEEEKDLKEMLILNESNIIEISFTRLDWRETISEVEAEYTDRAALYETGSLSDIDPANIEINNGISTSKNYSYPYFTNAENALWAAQRELMQQGYPLAAISIKGNRNLYALRIGDICCLDFPPYGVKKMLCRVTDVNIGDLVEGVVSIELLEDIFSLAKTDFGFSGSTEWKPTPIYPTGVQLFKFLELPYEIMRVKDTYVYALAVKPDEKTQMWTIWRKRLGGEFETTNSMSKWTAGASLVYDYDKFSDAEDLVGIEVIDLFGLEDLRFTALGSSGGSDIVSARRGGKLFIMDDEIMAWSNLLQLPNGHWRIEGIIRGVYDTVPVNHGNGAIAYFFESGHYGNVTTGGPVCKVGSAVTEFYNITAGTVDKQEDFFNGKIQELTTQRRTERPLSPGKIRLNAHLLFDKIHKENLSGDLELTWQPRNKELSYGCVSQNDETDFWTNAPIVVPTGLEYVVKVYNDSLWLKDYILPETAESFAYTWTQRVIDGIDLAGLIGETRVEIFSKLNGLESYQRQERTFKWQVPKLANIVTDEPTAIDCINNWGDSVEIIVPRNTASDVQYIKYTELPIILLGSKVLASGINTLIGFDGTYFVPDGQAILIEDNVNYKLITLDIGFVLKTEYKGSSTSIAYQYLQWDGVQFNEFK